MSSTLHRPDPVVCGDCQVSWLDPDLACWMCDRPGSLSDQLDVPWSAHATGRFNELA